MAGMRLVERNDTVSTEEVVLQRKDGQRLVLPDRLGQAHTIAFDKASGRLFVARKDAVEVWSLAEALTDGSIDHESSPAPVVSARAARWRTHLDFDRNARKLFVSTGRAASS